MMSLKLRIVWLGAVTLVALALIVSAALTAGDSPSVGIAANNRVPLAISPGQIAAIQGANQLLLLSNRFHAIYLPITRR